MQFNYRLLRTSTEPNRNSIPESPNAMDGDAAVHKPFTGSFAYRFSSTTATLFTPLHARYSRRSGVATMLRTTPPPDGIGFVLKVSDLGSNFTKVLGFTPDSLYQTSPSFVTAIP